jgi:hypothetical protein
MDIVLNQKVGGMCIGRGKILVALESNLWKRSKQTVSESRPLKRVLVQPPTHIRHKITPTCDKIVDRRLFLSSEYIDLEVIAMPRPKRTKVAPSAPAPRVRKSTKPAIVPKLIAAPKDGFNDVYDVSDPVEEAIASTRHIKKNGGKGKKTTLEMERDAPGDSVVDAGDHGLGEIRSMPGRPQGSPVIPSEKSLLENLDLDSSSSGIEVGRRDTTTVDNTSMAFGTFKRRPRQPSLLGSARVRARSSSVESNLADDTGLMSVGRRNTSILGMGNFKRRQREPSILGRKIDRARSSSPGLEVDVGTPAVGPALGLGNFKRRAQESSILGTGRKSRPQSTATDDEEDEGFNPEGESTPLSLLKTRNTTTSASSSANPRKRKLSARQVPEPSSPLHSTTRAEDQGSDQEIVPATASVDDESEEDGDAPTSSEEVPMSSIEAYSVTPEPASETMAPPHSSSEESPSPLPPRQAQRVQPQRAPSRGRRVVRSRTPLRLNNDSLPSSPPSLTHSPNGPPIQAAPKPRRRRQPPPASILSTAQLQALLPRRRRRGATRDPFDIASSDDEVDISGLASDDDELTHASIRAPPRRNLLTRLPAPLKKPNKVSAAIKAKIGGKATYSRVNAASDKENENENENEELDPNDSLGPLLDNEEVDETEDSQQLEKRVGKKLKRVVRKFKEVDEWEMEFEDNTASSSSPREAR